MDEKDRELLETMAKEIKQLRHELIVNRVIFAICLVVSLLYMHFRISHLRDIISVLVEMFLSG